MGPRKDDLAGRTFVVTGANTSTGRATVDALAVRDAQQRVGPPVL